MSSISSVTCPACGGNGDIEYSDNGPNERCEICKGSGDRPRCSCCRDLLAGDDLDEAAETCARCELTALGQWTADDDAWLAEQRAQPEAA